MIKHNPARIEAELPLTINSSWSQSYTQTLYINGSPFLSSQVSVNSVVDAFGILTIPGGESFDALRIRESMTVDGIITSVTYQFLTQSGANAAVFAVDPNPPDSGVIATEGFSWNPAFSGGGGGVVISLPPGYVMIAGEVDSIKYENWTGEVNLYYSIDNAASFELIDSNYTNPEGIYYWDVPDSLLTTEARIKIVDALDSTSISFSEQFYIKPWQLSRIRVVGLNDEFELYEPDQDGWSFCNCGFNQWPSTWWNQFDYQSGNDPFTNQSYPQSSPFDSAASSDFPDWPLFVDVFGVEGCYIESNNQLNYRSAATSFWGSNKGNWGGSCAGFSVTSLMGYYHRSDLNQYIGFFNNLFDFGLNDDARYVNNVFQTHQFGQGAELIAAPGYNNLPERYLKNLRIC
jgi:hypothetical protein